MATSAATIDPYLVRFESMRAERAQYDRKWQLVSDYVLPRRDFSITQRPNQLRPRRVTSSVATNANSRMAALLLAYWFDPTRPFLLPNVKRGLAVAGRDTQLDDAGLDYLGGLEWQVFDHMMLPKAQLMLRAGSMLKEFCSFGAGVIWTGRKRGFGPYFNGRPLQSCWWSENEEGVIDTLYFRMMLPIYRVLQRWPAAASVDGWKEAEAKPNEQNLTPILLACQPRIGGRAGAVAEAKPFAYVAVAEEKKLILEESGYDSFPYAVFRYDPMPGQTYAEGPGCQVLPHVMVLNHLLQAVENAASQKAEPAIAVPARMFGKTLDRRPGAVNAYNPSALGLTTPDKAILKLDLTGDPTEAAKHIEYLTNEIEMGYFVDWLRLREAGDMTAEEVGERRDMRLRGMSSIVANLELPTTQLGDRAMDVMAEEGQLGPAPASIAGAEVDWEYAGPLAVAQLRGNVQAMLQLLNARALIAKDPVDPAAAQAVDLEESLRVIAEGLAAPTRAMQSRQKVAAARAAQARQQADQQASEQAVNAGSALRDGGQGVAALANAGQGPPGAPGAPAPAPFAPASPFASPVATPVAA